MELVEKCHISSQKMTQWCEKIKTYAALGINTKNIFNLLENVSKTGTDKKGNTLLHYVSEIDSSKIVKYLIKAGFNINAKNRQDETALIKAILKNNEKTVKALITVGANTDHTFYRDCHGPLHFAATEGHTNLIKLLLNAGCDVNAKAGLQVTPLTIAIGNNNVEMVKILLDAGARRDNTYYRKNQGPLHLACEKNCLKVVELLVDLGFDVSATDMDRETPLYSTLYYGYGDEEPYDKNDVMGILNVLIQAGANVNTKDLRGRTPLHIAVDLGPEEVDLLLKAGARPDEADNDGNTPLLSLIGYENDHILSVTRLIEAGADINKINSKGHNCIHLATRNVAVEILTFVLERVAIPGLLDQNDMDPLDYAVYDWGYANHHIHLSQDLENENQILDNDVVLEERFGTKIIENQVRCIEILCKHTTKVNRVMNDRHLKYYNHTKIIRALLRQGMIVDFENVNVGIILVMSNSKSKLPLTLIRHAAICNNYKNGKGIINFNLKKLNEKQKKYYVDCLDELKRLNVFWVYETMPLFNLIEGRVSSRYIFNKDLIKAFKKGTIAKSFPIFKDELTESFKKEYEKYELISKATAGLQNLIKIDENLFALIYCNILKYLGTDDLHKLASFVNMEIS